MPHCAAPPLPGARAAPDTLCPPFCALLCSGIPTNDVDTNPAKGQRFPANGAIIFDESDDESDHGAYPFPLNATVEGAWLGCDPDVCSGDRHVLVRDNHTCLLYEGYSCRAPASMAGKLSTGTGLRAARCRRIAWVQPASHTRAPCCMT